MATNRSNLRVSVLRADRFQHVTKGRGKRDKPFLFAFGNPVASLMKPALRSTLSQVSFLISAPSHAGLIGACDDTLKMRGSR